jgi:hypothetical protein
LPLTKTEVVVNKEVFSTFLLIALGAVIIPIIFIWSADNIFTLTVKTWVAAFFLLLLARSVRRKKKGSPEEKNREND